MHTGAQLGGRATEVLEGVGEVDIELGDIVRSAVGQARLGQAPHPFVGVELGRVAGQRDQMQASEPSAQLTNGLAAVDRGVVPNDDHVTAQVTQEGAHAEAVDVGALHAIVQTHAVAHRTDREP